MITGVAATQYNREGEECLTKRKSVDVIASEELTEEQQPTNVTKKIWEVGDKKFVPKTLLKNVTNGSVNFNGSGILAHNTFSDLYTGSLLSMIQLLTVARISITIELIEKYR